MIFGIFILLLLAAIAFFHYVQGFLSSTISAVLAIFSAVIAVSYYETIVEGPLAGVAPEWMPTLILLGLFGLPYVILRTLFDKLVPGQVQLPAVVDKIGGAVMGLVAGVFGLGVVVIGAQYMPFGPSVGGYVRYETADSRGATIPPGLNALGQPAGRSKDASTYNEVVGPNFDPEKAKGLFIVPVDDLVVKTVAHLSDQGSLATGKPMRSVHPDLLQELFGQRLGIQAGANRVAVNSAKRTDIEVTGVYDLPPVPADRIVDAEFTKMREAPIKLAANTPAGELRLVVRVKFNPTAADTKDRIVRLSPGSVRLVGLRPDEVFTDQLVEHNYYPIGTLEPNGLLYAHKIDDFLFVATPGKKVDGSDSPAAEVDFVFQVKDQGILTAGSEPNTSKLASGTFLEVKKFGRVDLGSGDVANVKRVFKPNTVLAIKRKNLQLEKGPAPMQPGKGNAGFAGASANPPPGPGGGGGGLLGQRLEGEWKTGTVVTGAETLTFAADGTLTSVTNAGTAQLRWIAAGPPQGETLTIKTAPSGQDPSSGETRTIVFEDINQFSMADSAGNRRFARVGSAPVEAAPAPSGPDATVSAMVGTWESAGGLSYTFRPDMNYSATQAAVEGKQARTGGGTWRVKAVRDDGKTVDIELVSKTGNVTPQTWSLANSTTELRRVGTDGAQTSFARKS